MRQVNPADAFEHRYPVSVRGAAERGWVVWVNRHLRRDAESNAVNVGGP